MSLIAANSINTFHENNQAEAWTNPKRRYKIHGTRNPTRDFPKILVTDTVFGEQTFCFFVGPVRFAIRHVTHDSLHRQLSIDKSPSRHAYSADAAQKVILKIKGATAAAASPSKRFIFVRSTQPTTPLPTYSVRVQSELCRLWCVFVVSLATISLSTTERIYIQATAYLFIIKR